MSRWFRHYAGMMRDDKLVRVSIRSKQTIERVLWVWGVILESAAEKDEGGLFDVDVSEMAYFLRADEADVQAIIDGLIEAERIGQGIVINWGARQFQSDRSKDRVAAYRERKKAENQASPVTTPSHNDDVTLQQRHCNAPETETDTETYNNPPTPLAGGKPIPVRKRAIKAPLPEDWAPGPFGEGTQSRAIVEGWHPQTTAEQVEAFRAYHCAKGNQQADWQAAWSTWVLNSKRYGTARAKSEVPL